MVTRGLIRTFNPVTLVGTFYSSMSELAITDMAKETYRIVLIIGQENGVNPLCAPENFHSVAALHEMVSQNKIY
jgi:hypothetical protein